MRTPPPRGGVSSAPPEGGTANLLLRFALVGPMGAGKSTVGAALAARLNLPFFDGDWELERNYGKPVPEIFAHRGEAFFRSLESEVLRELLEESGGAVLATGGGAVLAAENRSRLKAWGGRVVYLRVPLGELLRRLECAPPRPLLQGWEPERRLRKILAQREILYRKTADWVVECAGRPVSGVVDEICRRARASGVPGGDS